MARPALDALPLSPGVYRFRDEGGRILYIGRAGQLRRRVASYWGDLRDRPRLRRMVARIDRVEALVCDSEHEAAWLERNLLEQAKPRWNRTAGAEVPVYLRLRHRGAVTELSIVHDSTPGSTQDLRFGPYLGGSKVRLAASGLGRVVPLAYAGDRLAGFDRDYARVRGVAPGDRTALVDLATRVLAGSSGGLAEVLGLLTARRDAAAAALAFELAARIQAELDALAWVFAEQKVTRPDGADLDVCGWRDGLLLTLQVRAGRLRGWAQRRCGEDVARVRLDATPPAWRPFADRNAALAARLYPPPS